jgi:cell division protein FtsB
VEGRRGAVIRLSAQGSALKLTKLGLKMNKVLKISILSLLLLALVASWLAFGDRGLIYVYKKDKERQAYGEKIRQLKEANQKLMDEIDRLRNDKDYIEETARKELGMVRDGEVIYRFAKDKDNKKKASTQGTDAQGNN